MFVLPTKTTCTAANLFLTESARGILWLSVSIEPYAVVTAKDSTLLALLITLKTAEKSPVKATMLPSRARGERTK
jgi:hypothetical protein